MDHAGAVPYFLEKTNFKGKCFMTYPTKAIYRLVLADSAKVKNSIILFEYKIILLGN